MILRWALLPRVSYEAARALEARLLARRQRGGPDLALATEHEPVVTLGRRGDAGALILPAAEIRQRGVAVLQADRGGLATYHGPGQLLLYPVVELRGVGVRRFVALLEDAALAVTAAAGLEGTRVSGQPGVWVSEAKVAAVGLRVRRGIASHGLAINLEGDLTPFTWIHPCGISGALVSTLAALGGRRLTLRQAAEIALGRLADGLGAQLEEVPHATLDSGDDGRGRAHAHPQPSAVEERFR